MISHFVFRRVAKQTLGVVVFTCSCEVCLCQEMDNFEIQEELGRGTFGVVRKCLDKRTQEIVAIKEINMELNGQRGDIVANEIKVSCIDFDIITVFNYLIVWI